MKAAPFAWVRPAALDAALAALAVPDAFSKALAGGQSLGPMLNLRVAQPDRLVDLSALDALTQVTETADAVTFGARVTHAAIEDRRVPDPTRGLMPTIAAHIAYRAIRNRGTLGGSLAHADPAADWVSAMTLLDATLLIAGRTGSREVPMNAFMDGAFTTALAEDELLVAVRVPRLSPTARWGWTKLNRKPGEFAHAIGAVLVDAERDVWRAVVGATQGTPYCVTGRDAVLALHERPSRAAALDAAGIAADDPVARQLHAVALERALQQADAR
ncbi:MAG: FAD binding domain-containing protein [Burkholderiales bacterium]|nr:FAD binding domain-containing protein [Burkholderiales bacterium]